MTSVFFREYIPLGEKKLMSAKRPGINVKLHLDLGLLLFPGRNENLIVLCLAFPLKVLMGLEAQSPEGKLEKWRP